MAAQCDIHYNKRAVGIDVRAREVDFADGSSARYGNLICTLPLDKTIRLAGIQVDEKPDPCTSVLVLNIGGSRGPSCPDDHWLYYPTSRSGFHRVGFYSNVDRSFLPTSAQERGDRVSIYVERTYLNGSKPTDGEIRAYSDGVTQELTEWGFIESADVADPTWIDVAYTWAWPGSNWKTKAIKLLEEEGVYMVGRYARWSFQGIAKSIRDGFVAGASFKKP